MAKKQSDKQAINSWNSYVENFLSSVTAAQNETPEEKDKRIKNLEKDYEAWKLYYFPKYCTSPSAKFHKASARRKLNNPEWYECDAWARELAKDVSEMMLTLYQALTKRKKSIIFISNSWDNAANLLKPYKLNLEKNERIISDYGIQENPGNWREGDFITSMGVSFLAVGAGQSPRGSRNEEVRPDKVIISDIDTDEDCRNPDIIKKKWEWFEKAVIPLRSVSKDTQYIWLNNIIAKDCCMKRAMQMADYVAIVNLEDKDGNSTWPEKNKPEHIARIKDKMSTAAYQAEYMNNPLSEGTVFKEMHYGKVPPLRKFKALCFYGDPAPSNKENKKNSYKAGWLIGKYEERFYVVSGWLEQVKNSTFVNWYWDIQTKVPQQAQLYRFIENNSLQDPFYEQVFIPLFLKKGEETGVSVSIAPDERKKPDKFARIEGNLEPLNRQGRLILNEAEKGSPHMQRLEEQFKLVEPGLPSPADGPDCIEGGVWILNNKLNTIGQEVKVTKRPRNKKRF